MKKPDSPGFRILFALSLLSILTAFPVSAQTPPLPGMIAPDPITTTTLPAATTVAPVVRPAAPASATTPISPAAAAPTPEEKAAALDAKRRDTIRYGIDSEIFELIRTLGASKEGKFNDELLALLGRSRSPKLRISLLDLFALLEWKDAETAALRYVEERDREETSLVSSSLSYLAAIRSSRALAFVAEIVKEDDKKLLPALLRLMGRAGGATEEDLLLSWFESDSATESLRQDAIRALGEIGSSKAAERLWKFLDDAEKNRASRMYACEALGKIRDEKAVPSLVKAANGEDPNLRTSAIEALGTFATPEAEAALTEALRDSFAKARIAACKGIGARRIESALPFLRYKAASDPEKAVRTEAFRAMASLGGEGFAFMRERMEDKKEDALMRSLCFGLLMRKDFAASRKALETRLAAEAGEKDKALYTSLAREVSNAQDSPEAGSLASILLADKDYLIRIAGIEWIRKNKATGLRSELERLSKDDPSDAIRKRATDALKNLN